MTEEMTMAKLEADIRDEAADEYTEGCDISELAHSLAETNMPVYDSEVMEVAASDHRLVTEAPVDGMGHERPLDLIRLNIFERLWTAAYEALEPLLDEEGV